MPNSFVATPLTPPCTLLLVTTPGAGPQVVYDGLPSTGVGDVISQTFPSGRSTVRTVVTDQSKAVVSDVSTVIDVQGMDSHTNPIADSSVCVIHEASIESARLNPGSHDAKMVEGTASFPIGNVMYTYMMTSQYCC